MKTFAAILFSTLALSLAVPVAQAQTPPPPPPAIPGQQQSDYQTCISNAKSAFDRARCGLDKIGGGTGFGATLKPEQDKTFYDKFAQVVNIVIGLTGIVATIYLIYSGIKWMRAGGNEELIKEAKTGIKAAIIGLLVIFISYILVNFVVTQLIPIIVL